MSKVSGHRALRDTKVQWKSTISDWVSEVRPQGSMQQVRMAGNSSPPVLDWLLEYMTGERKSKGWQFT